MHIRRKKNSGVPNMSNKINFLNGNKAKRKIKTSAATKYMYEKWHGAAIKICGPNAKLTLIKTEAKPLIHGFLYKCFAPKNIDDIYRYVGFITM